MLSCKFLFSVLLLCTFYSCGDGKPDSSSTENWGKEEVPVAVVETAEPEDKVEPFSDTLKILTDSINVGIKGKTRVELTIINNQDSCFSVFRSFKKTGWKWKQTQKLILHASAISSPEPEFADFNFDGFNDFLFISADAARGGNRPQTLLIYDSAKSTFFSVHNSEHYPNLEVSKKLKCLTSFYLTAGQTTVFLKMKRNQLVPFIEVDQRDGFVTVESVDGDKRKLLKRVVDKHGFDRFSDYDPLTAE